MLWGTSAFAAPGAEVSWAHTVMPATTNIVAVLGVFPSGPVNEAVLVNSWENFRIRFGSLDTELPFGTQPSMAVYAVWQLFLGGGVGAWIVRLDAPSSAVAQVTIEPLTLRASGVGVWANGVLVELQPSSGAKQMVGAAPGTPDHVDLAVTSPAPAGQAVVREVISALPADGKGALSSAINTSSFYVTATAPTSTVRPDSQPFEGATVTVGGLTLTTPAAWAHEAALTATTTASAGGGGLVDLTLTSAPRTVLETLPNLANDDTAMDLAAAVTQQSSYLSATPQGTGPLLPQIQGLTAGAAGSWSVGSLASAVLAQVGEPESPSAPEPLLDQIAPEVFNIMCIPDLVFLSTATQGSVIAAAQRFCKARQAFLIADPPPPAAAMTAAWLPGADATPVDAVGTPGGMASLNDWADQIVGPEHDEAAAYYPWVRIADPWNNGTPRYVPPSGSVAGVYATTDQTRGVWKAPAGAMAPLVGVAGLADPTVDDTVDGILNEQGINSLRYFAGSGNVVWGARTLAGAGAYSSPFRYVSTIRLAYFIEQTLQQSLKWAAFEPNGPQLWSWLAIEVNEFMAGLYSHGAFSGATAAEAYQVTCDATTTSAADMQAGIVNLELGFTPAAPAEFIELNITTAALRS
jgi:uncharacterized protein